VGDQRHTPAALSTGGEQVPLVQEAGWAPGQPVHQINRYNWPYSS